MGTGGFLNQPTLARVSGLLFELPQVSEGVVGVKGPVVAHIVVVVNRERYSETFRTPKFYRGQCYYFRQKLV
jgi:hypothetical protein